MTEVNYTETSHTIQKALDDSRRTNDVLCKALDDSRRTNDVLCKALDVAVEALTLIHTKARHYLVDGIDHVDEREICKITEIAKAALTTIETEE